MRETIRKHGGKAAGAAGAIALASTLIYGFEGERNRVYRDVVGIKTYCIGETLHPVDGKTYSHEECMTLLGGRLEEFNAAIDRCVHVALPTGPRAALLSFTYNLGEGAMCRSSVVVHFNAGDIPGGCNAMLRYDHAGGRVVRGLTRRREAERKVCLDKAA